MMREVEVRYRYRLRINRAQAEALMAVFDSCRAVWNQALGRWGELWREEKLGYSYGEMAAELTDWRATWEWLAAQPQCPQQQTLRRLSRAIRAFFDRTNPAGRPRFKSRKRGEGVSAEWTRNGFKVSGSGLGQAGDRIEVAVAGGRIPLRAVWSRRLPSEPSSLTIYRDRAERWWASFVCRVEVPDRPVRPTARSTGLDVGLDTFATVEDPAHDVKNPRFAKTAAKAKRRVDRNLARTHPGSNHRAKVRLRRARIEARIAARRADFHQKEARKLVAVYDRIGVEDFKIKRMTRRGRGRRRTGLNRAISDASWAAFRRTLVWQAAKAGKAVVVSPVRDSTQHCSHCGAIAKPRIHLSDRVFQCRVCGLVLGRDRNAARNLNPDRPGPDGRTEPSGPVPAGVDGTKTLVPAGSEAA
jgi:putative transposase